MEFLGFLKTFKMTFISVNSGCNFWPTKWSQIFPQQLVPFNVLLISLIISPFSYLYKNEIQAIDRQAFKGLVSLEQL